MGFCNVWLFTCTEKSQSGYVVSTGSGQTLQWEPKSPVSAEIIGNQNTESIVAYSLLWYLVNSIFTKIYLSKRSKLIPQSTKTWHSTFCQFLNTSWSISICCHNKLCLGLLFSNFFATVTLAWFCQKVERHKLIFLYIIWKLLILNGS